MSVLLTISFCTVYLSAAAFLCRDLKLTTRDLCLCALVIGLTLILESIQIPLPTGASISFFSMVPFMVLSAIHFRLAIFGGFVTGALALLMIPGWQPVCWGQFFVEHLVCFSCIGFTGIFGSRSRKALMAGFVLAACIKLSGHILSGVLFFSQNAWEGWGPWGYSIAYNLSSSLPLSILCGIVFFLLPMPMLYRLQNAKRCQG